MKNHTQVMSIRESQRLVELEKTIAKGKKTFVEVGLALAEIRDLRLYKREYGGFEEYCREKWGWEKAYANHVIRAADVVKSLPDNLATIVATETQARELAKIPAEHRAGVVQAVLDEGKPVTAAEIKRHLPPVPVRPTSPPVASPAPPPPSRVLDGTGWPIPTQLIPLWLRSDEMGDLRAAEHSLFSRAPVIVSSIQTQCAGGDGGGRMAKFDPARFGCVILDECHHATSSQWQRVIGYFRTNPNLKICGITATPDRADEAALGQVFQSVAFEYEILDGIKDGWLVLRQRQAGARRRPQGGHRNSITLRRVCAAGEGSA